MERLDKVIAGQGFYSRNDVKKLVAGRLVTVDGVQVSRADLKIDPEQAEITIAGNRISTRREAYLLLNKPIGYTSTIEGNRADTVLDLVPPQLYRDGLDAAGRLDREAEGLMVLTTDGQLMHNIVSPARRVRKIYEITLDVPVTEGMIRRFSEGIRLSENEIRRAWIAMVEGCFCRVTALDARYFQIRKMFEACRASVTAMRRICIGNLMLPADLETGHCRACTKEELELVQKQSKEPCV